MHTNPRVSPPGSYNYFNDFLGVVECVHVCHDSVVAALQRERLAGKLILMHELLS